MILVIDNYDSFTFNLVQYMKKLGNQVVVFRYDQISLSQIEEMSPRAILISPGPGNPDTAGACLAIVKRFYKDIPILGVCLGQQIIVQAFGGRIRKAIKPMHGKISRITHDGRTIFQELPSPMQVARYHSLIIDDSTLPDCIEVSAKSENGEIMAVRHKRFKVEGVQFHPESILTEHGMQMLQNFFSR